MSAIMDVSDQPEGSVSDAGRYALGLTGQPCAHPGSGTRRSGHRTRRHGQEGRSARGARRGDPLAGARSYAATPAGSPWPRHIGYCGNDAGFIGWSERRPIEQFSWTPAFGDACRVDAGAARIQTLQLRWRKAAAILT